MQFQLGRAVNVEDYEEAGRIKVAIAATATSDAVGHAIRQLNVGELTFILPELS